MEDLAERRDQESGQEGEAPGEGHGPVDDLLVERVSQTATRIMERVERLIALEPAESHLNLRQVRLLKFLFRRGATPVSSLAEALRAPLSSTSELVAGLVREGYVEKVRDPEDRRVVLVRLTGKGFDEVGRRLLHQQEAFRRILALLEPTARLRFADALSELERTLDEALLGAGPTGKEEAG